MKKIIGCSLVALMLSTPALADGIDTYVNFDTRDVNISGIVEQASFNRMVSVVVSDSEKKYYVDTVSTDTEGAYNTVFQMPENAQTGYYTISVDALGLDSAIKQEFYFAKREDIESTLGLINDAENVGAVKKAVDENLTVLNLPSEWYNSLGSAGKTAIAEVLYNSKPYKAIGDMTDVAYKELAVQAFNYASDGDTVSKALDKFSDVYDINENTAACYELYTGSDFGKDAREIMASYPAKSVDDVIKAYNESTLLAAINNSKDPNGILKLISEYRAVIPFSLDTYDKSDKEKTAAYLYKNTPFKTMSALEKAIEAAYKQQSSTTSGGGGGGNAGNVVIVPSSSGGGSRSVKSINTPVSGTSTAQTPDNDTQPMFSDLSDAQWAKAAIEYLAGKQIVNGMGNNKFEPNGTVTREQFVVMIVNAFNLKGTGAASSFEDMPQSHWAYDAVSSACELGVIFGLDENKFGTGQSITRQDMAVIAYRASKIAGYTFDEADELNFNDKDNISDYAKESVSAMSAEGIINGYPDGSFGPSLIATRAQAAQIIYSIVK